MISEAEIQVTGRIISYSRRIEQVLTNHGATASGLHDKVDELAARIPVEIQRKIRFIASVRNKVAHRVDDPGELPPVSEFEAACADVLKFFGESIEPEAAPRPEAVRRPEVPAPPETASVEDPSAVLETQLRERIRRVLTILAFVPGLQAVYLAACMWRALYPALGACAAFLCVGGSVPLLITGALRHDDFVLWSGVVFCLFGWLEALWLGWNEGRARRVKFIHWAMPLWNLGFLGVLIFKETDHPPFVWSFLSLAATVAGGLLLRERVYEYGAAALLGAGYAAGVALFCYQKLFASRTMRRY